MEDDYKLIDALRASLKYMNCEDNTKANKDQGRYDDEPRNNANPAALEIEILSALLREAVERLRWCSGSSDFSEEGKASE